MKYYNNNTLLHQKKTKKNKNTFHDIKNVQWLLYHLEQFLKDNHLKGFISLISK